MNSCTNAISFCELMHVFKDDAATNESIVLMVQKEAGYEKLDRLYIGSSFCCRYFIRYTEEAMKKISAFWSGRVTLCAPIFSQTYLETGKETIQRLVGQYGDMIDEVTVNDYGMLSFASTLVGVKVNVGRLMNKDTRDIRHDEYFNAPHTPSVCTLKNAIYERYAISSYEFDLTNRFLSFGDFQGEVAIYTPYAFATVGHICEFGSIPASIEKKFRPNDKCAFDCAKTSINYETPYGERYLKLGRAVFFKVEDYAVQTEKPYRAVYEPFDLFKPGRVQE